MTLVTDFFTKLLERQVEQNGVVVWFDADRTYANFAATLTLPATQVFLWDGSFLALRRAADALMNQLADDHPPRLVLYVPLAQEDTEFALDEFVHAGVVVKPGGATNRNTNLEVIARAALKPVLGAEGVETICEQVRHKQIQSLTELDMLAEQGQSDPTVIKLVFGTGQPDEVALLFLADSARDRALVERNAQAALSDLLNRALDAHLPEGDQPEELRSRLRKHVFITEFLSSLQGSRPNSLQSVPLPQDPRAVEACVTLVRTWRNRRDLQTSYIEASRRVEQEFGISNLELDWHALAQTETFRAGDERLLQETAAALKTNADEALFALVENRQSRFWAQVDAVAQTRWALTATLAQLLQRVAQVRSALKQGQKWHAADYIEAYANASAPWCAMDAAHRTMERLALSIDPDAHGRDAALEQLIAFARQQYAETVDIQTRRFMQAYADARFMLGGVLSQTEVFARFVSPFGNVKTAYVLVDALRFEMARDLLGSLHADWNIELVPALATPPTITAVGMAALMPGAERSATLTAVGGGKLGLAVGGHILTERKQRIEYLKSQFPTLHEVKLEALVGAKKTVREAIRAASFVLVTSQEIDSLGENENTVQAREFMDTVPGKLARAFRLLADLGVKRIVVTADHGYLFADELEAAQLVPSPGGQTVELHRRVWIGKGGDAHDNTLRVPASAFNLGSDLEMVFPYGLSGFSAGGSKAYMHGGLSLQELVIPVLKIEPGGIAPALTAAIEWTLLPGSPKLTTRFFSVTVQGSAYGIFEMVPPRVRVEIRLRNKPISQPVAATYGLSEATGEIHLQLSAENALEIQPNTVALMLQTDPDNTKTVTIVLLNAETEQTLAELNVEVAISL